jgi:hypothetical protein
VGSPVIGRNYFAAQVALLLKFAQTTADRQVAAGLLDKAADLKDRLDEAPSPKRDLRVRAPDVQA